MQVAQHKSCLEGCSRRAAAFHGRGAEHLPQYACFSRWRMERSVWIGRSSLRKPFMCHVPMKNLFEAGWRGARAVRRCSNKRVKSPLKGSLAGL